MKFGNLKEGQSAEAGSRSSKEVFTFYRSLTGGTTVSDFQVMHEELRPQHRTSPPHFHTEKDEMYIILRGIATAYVDGKPNHLKAGDYVVFPSGERTMHFLTNETSEIVELLNISSCPKADFVEFEKRVPESAL